METISNINVQRISHSRIHEVDFNKLEFGKYVSDHMLVCDYKNGEWSQPQILPFGDLSLSPTSLVLHYGQAVFEGMKAFRMQDKRINIFRMEKHYDRFAKSLERMAMAIPPKEIFVEGLAKLIALDKAWVPVNEGDALYIRPFEIATEAKFGVKVSDKYSFIIFTGPVATAYNRPIKVKVETNYTRAAKGGTGFTKCSGNYGAAFFPTQLARKEGFDQVLWTDARDHQYIEESGMMNVMFVIDGKIVTPPLSDSILDGITRDSLLTVANDLGYTTEERPVSLEELRKSFRDKSITEAAGIGTAAVVAPICVIHLDEIDFHLPELSSGYILNKLKAELENIRSGRSADTHNWNYIV